MPMYMNYVKTLSQRFEASVSYVQHVYGFDAGDEFEVAICKTLRTALPIRFGICRGHVVTRDGDEAGDDIIIYDRMLFPTLRLLPDEDYSRKEWIPIEAVYAYIEAKHTLNLEDAPDPNGKKSTLRHACKQVKKVKESCGTRESIPPEMITRSLSLDPGMVGMPEGWPGIRNPMFGMILSRFARNHTPDRIEDANVIRDTVQNYPIPNSENSPDLIVCGASNISIPFQPGQQGGSPLKLFRSLGTGYEHRVTPDIAFGVALCTLLAVLDRIQLGELPFLAIINDALNPA